jgi:hypothetical protein
LIEYCIGLDPDQLHWENNTIYAAYIYIYMRNKNSECKIINSFFINELIAYLAL